MMHHFTAGVGLYAVLCVIGIIAIIVLGDGPHPRAIALYPYNGDQYWPGGTAQITFSQPMDQSGVERALQVVPGAQGQGAWFGNTLNLQPDGDWRSNVTYHVKLVGSVTDDQGRPLAAPVSFSFRVHHVQHVTSCLVGGVRNVCERLGATNRPLTQSPRPVTQFALSPDGTFLAYIHRDRSGLPHLFIIQVDGMGATQLTSGTQYADTRVLWSPHVYDSVDYYRRPILSSGTHRLLGAPQLWNINVDGTHNGRLSG